MLLNIHGKNFEVTHAMKEHCLHKLSNLQKYFAQNSELDARVLVKVYNEYHKVEVTVETPVGLLRSETKAYDFYAALDIAIDKLEDQIRRQ